MDGFDRTCHFLVNDTEYVLLLLMMLNTTPRGRRWNAQSLSEEAEGGVSHRQSFWPMRPKVIFLAGKK